MQGRGAMLAFWDDVLPAMPDEMKAEHLASSRRRWPRTAVETFPHGVRVRPGRDHELVDDLEAVLLVPLLADLDERVLADQAEGGLVGGGDRGAHDPDSGRGRGPGRASPRGPRGRSPGDGPPGRPRSPTSTIPSASGAAWNPALPTARRALVVPEHARDPGQRRPGCRPPGSPGCATSTGTPPRPATATAAPGWSPRRARGRRPPGRPGSRRRAARSSRRVPVLTPASSPGSRRPPSRGPSAASCAAWSAAGRRRPCRGCGRSRAGGSGRGCRRR